MLQAAARNSASSKQPSKQVLRPQRHSLKAERTPARLETADVLLEPGRSP